MDQVRKETLNPGKWTIVIDCELEVLEIVQVFLGGGGS